MFEPFDGFYRGKRVLVTGHTGFKGSWLALWLSELGAEVWGFALPPEQEESHFVQTRLAERINHRTGDIRAASLLADAFEEAQPDLVFHLAAQALVRRSYAQPRDTFHTNVLGSVNLLDAVRASSSCRAAVYVTSDKCYRNREWVWGYRESDELGGEDPYSASKAAAELVLSAYQESFFRGNGTAVAAVRAGNVIGGGDWSPDRLVPDCIRALQAGEPVRLRCPSATRPWQHVLDPLAGYLSVGANLWSAPEATRGAWNFGPPSNQARTVRDVADAVVETWGEGEVVVDESATDLPEANLLHLNCDKAHYGLGWQTRWDFRTAVSRATDWYRRVHDGEGPVACSLDQIREFSEALANGAADE